MALRALSAADTSEQARRRRCSGRRHCWV